MDENRIRALIPSGKSDDVGGLASLTLEEVQLIATELLEWCVDVNWPVAIEIGAVFTRLGPPIAPTVRNFLTTHNAIDNWGILASIRSPAIWFELRNLLERIANNPTADERVEGLDEIAANWLTRLALWGPVAVEPM
jgi:Domain of unknown function (DUF5071)